MADEKDPKRKVQSLLRRFPVSDLAIALSKNPTARRAFLRKFVTTSPTLSYVPSKDAASVVYGVQKPLFEMPVEKWESIEESLRRSCRPDLLDMNLLATRALFDLIRPKEYKATECEPQLLRVQLQRAIKIELSYYITDGDRVIFQFFQPRSSTFSDESLTLLGSIIHHAYVVGAYEEAEVEIANLCAPAPRCPRNPTIVNVPRGDIFGLPELTERINEVYELLGEIALNPKKS